MTPILSCTLITAQMRLKSLPVLDHEDGELAWWILAAVIGRKVHAIPSSPSCSLKTHSAPAWDERDLAFYLAISVLRTMQSCCTSSSELRSRNAEGPASLGRRDVEEALMKLYIINTDPIY